MDDTQLETQLRNSLAVLGNGEAKRKEVHVNEQQLAVVKEFSPPAARQLFTINTFAEAMQLAAALCKTEFVPETYRGKPEAALAAIILGHELGLGPLQAMQGIAMIGGKPCVWGDTALALCQRHPDFVNIIESYDAVNRVATCTIHRRGREPKTHTFSWADAERAKLTRKDTYQSYPQRMLPMRARSWCMRDTFADALRGLAIYEEVRDYVQVEPSGVVTANTAVLERSVANQERAALPAAAAVTVVTSSDPREFVLRSGKNVGKTLGQLADQGVDKNGVDVGFKTLEWYALQCKDLPTKAAAAELFSKMQDRSAPKVEVIDTDGVVTRLPVADSALIQVNNTNGMPEIA